MTPKGIHIRINSSTIFFVTCVSPGWLNVTRTDKHKGRPLSQYSGLALRFYTLDKNISGLLSAIHTLDRRLLWFTIAIFILTVVQVGLSIYFRNP